jgi:hypothetical protein|tara:strand:+ start:298 stop:450 length:153 start_codon:yes stop_codon:yes gene_type:complete
VSKVKNPEKSVTNAAHKHKQTLFDFPLVEVLRAVLGEYLRKKNKIPAPED